MEKVVNPTVPKNNLFHQVYSITTFEVVFSHPLGLTEGKLKVKGIETANFEKGMIYARNLGDDGVQDNNNVT